MKPLAITLGDPAGIGPEVVLKALAGTNRPVWLFGNLTLTKLSGPLPAVERFVDIPSTSDNFRFGEVSARNGTIALQSIAAAIDAVESGKCSALVTAPIHKVAIAEAGSKYPGHTELLAARAGLSRYGYEYAMFFDSPTLRTVLLTVHLPLRDAIRELDAATISALASLTDREYHRLYKTRPRIAVAGINPHAGEEGRFGDEEKVIARGVEDARAAGIEISGPYSPDTVFLAARRGKFDVVMAMYHDQGLIPVKTLDFERSVNVTLGLPWLRVSVDHGTAFDIAGRGIADASPMRYAIEWAARHADAWES